MRSVQFNDVKHLINEADVLLFRGQGIASWFISKGSQSRYTHVALASWSNGNTNRADGILECVEFREGSLIAGLFNKNAAGGGRAVNLENIVKDYCGQIDVYRPATIIRQITISEDFLAKEEEIVLDPKAVTRAMRKMTGLPYGWKRIWWIMKHKMAGFRMLPYDGDDLANDTFGKLIYPVCSTAVAHCFNSTSYDLIRNKSDNWTEPGDVAMSSRLSYLFTLEC